MAVIKRQRSTAKETITGGHDLFEIYTQVPIPVNAIADKLDIEIKYDEELDKQTSGYLKFKDNRWTIGVNAKHHIGRQRYIIAHEIGHYMLHKQHAMTEGIMQDSTLFKTNEKDNREIAANNFANNLLMPEEAFNREIKAGMTSIDSLSQHFDVCSLAIRYRAKELGYEGHGV